MRVWLVGIGAALVAVLAADAASASEPPPRPSASDIAAIPPPPQGTVAVAIPSWRDEVVRVGGAGVLGGSRRRRDWEIAAFGWISGVKGNAVIDGFPVNINASVGDVLENADDLVDNLEALTMASVGFRRNRWRAELVAYFMRIGETITFQGPLGTTLDASATLRVVEATAGYDVVSRSLGGTRRLDACVLAGARYFAIDVDVVSDPGGSQVAEDQGWVDPVVGAAATWTFSPRWALHARGDVGGFGITSDLTWSLRADVEWRAKPWFGLRLGWAALSEDYSTGSGADEFLWDVILHGPFVGVVFRL